MKTRYVLLVLSLLLPLTMLAQEPATQRRIDSLEAIVRQQPADTTVAMHHNELAWRLQQSDGRRAFRHAFAALGISRKLDFARGEGKALTLIGVVHSIGGNFDSARHYYKQALALRRRLHDRPGEAAVLNNLGLTYLFQGNYPRATATLVQSLRIEEQLGDSLRLAEGYVNLGNVFLQIREYGQAQAYYERFLRLARQPLARAQALNNLSIVTNRLGNHSRALQYAQQAVALARATNDQLTLGESLGNAGSVYEELRDFAAAAAAYRESLAISEKLEQKENIANSLVSLGSNMEQLGQPAALPYLTRGLSLAQEIGARPLERTAHLELAEALAARGDYQAAYAHMQAHRQLNDSLLTEESSQQIQELRTQFETEQKEQANRIQALQLTEKDEIIRRQNAQLVAMLLALAGAAGIGWLLWNRARLRRRLEVEQVQRRQQHERAAAVLEAEERERRRIGADLHDSVGQLLSAAKLNLSGLQHELQLRNPSQETLLTNALDTLDESLREVRSLSHQLVPNALLRSGLAAAVREFIDKLGSSGHLQVELEAIGLDERLPLLVENVVYRAVQEAVANIVKHARASHVTVQLLGQPRELTVLIEDNGVGFDLAQALARPDAGIGLRNLYSRVAYLGGRLDIDSRPGRGTIVTIDVPLSPPPA